MTLADARAMLVALLPAGIDKWLDLSEGSDPWRLLDGAAQGFLDAVLSPLDDVATNADPITILLDGIGAWETACGLTPTSTDGIDTRRARIVGRLREYGAPTWANTVASLASVTGTDATLIRVTRAQLDTLNSYAIPGGTAAPSGSVTLHFAVGDNAPCSKAGARIFLTFAVGAASPANVSVVLVAPTRSLNLYLQRPVALDGAAHAWYWPELAGQTIDGAWSLVVTNSDAAAVVLTSGAVIVEGIGRDSTSGADGHGAPAFEWSALVNEATAAPLYTRANAIESVGRWTQAHAGGGLAIYMTDGGATALCDDDNCIADLAICD